MAIKSPSDYPNDTAATSTDMFVMEKASAAGVLKSQTRAQIHKLRSGEVLDTNAGVNLVLKADGNTAITITNGAGFVQVAQLFTAQGNSVFNGPIRVDDGIRVNTSTLR